jgi:putative DNA primase/helicase
MNIELQFLHAAQSAGIYLDDEIIANGTLHRCHIKGHKPGTKNGAYVLHTGLIPAGWAKDHKTGKSFSWKGTEAQSGKLLNPERAFIQAAVRDRQIERENDRYQATLRASTRARSIWAEAVIADASNAYCSRKKIKPYGARMSYYGDLIVPISNAKNELVSLQFIQADGTKRFLTGGQKKSCFFTISGDPEVIIVTEGYATGCSIYQDCGYQIVVAFDAGNLRNVAQIIRQQNPFSEIIIAGDNDESGFGQAKAKEAALAIRGKIMIPHPLGFDWNDYLTMEPGDE